MAAEPLLGVLPNMEERSTGFRLLALSFLMLFLELALIRWLGANVLYLSYFSNLVLLGSFLGIGVAFLVGERSRSSGSRLPWTLLLIVGLVIAFPIEVGRSSKASSSSATQGLGAFRSG